MATDSIAPGGEIVMLAIDWMVRLQSGTATEQEREACRRWRAAEARHELAWQRLQSLSERVSTLPSALAHGSIGDGDTRHRNNRRFAVKTLCVAMGVGLVAAGSSEAVPWRALMAEYSTRAGERRRVVLADGSVVELNTATAIDTAYDEQCRLVRLHRGEVLVTTAHERGRAYRSLVVHTRLGLARALGTRFQVRDSEAGMRIAVFEERWNFIPSRPRVRFVSMPGARPCSTGADWSAMCRRPRKKRWPGPMVSSWPITCRSVNWWLNWTATCPASCAATRPSPACRSRACSPLTSPRASWLRLRGPCRCKSIPSLPTGSPCVHAPLPEAKNKARNLFQFSSAGFRGAFGLLDSTFANHRTNL